MNSVPLTDVLPWGDTIPKEGRTILICDSTETDGRFLLYTMASQCLNNNNNNSNNNNAATTTSSSSSTDAIATTPTSEMGKILWIHCGCSTDDQIRMALKKAGSSDVSSSSTTATTSTTSFSKRSLSGGMASMSLSSSLNVSTSASSRGKGSMLPLQIMNIMHELSEHYLSSENIHGNDDDDVPSNEEESRNLFMETFVKNKYLQIREWINQQRSNNNNNNTIVHPLIIIDNVSLLSNQIGSKLTHLLLQKIQSILKGSPTSSSSSPPPLGCLTILHSNDFDQEYSLQSTQQSKRNTNVTGGKIIQYIGGGGRGILCDSEEMAVLNQRMVYELEYVWERCLVEMADGIVDVMPLKSGFARDVHGRLVFTDRPGSMGFRDYDSGGGKKRVYNTSRNVVSRSNNGNGSAGFRRNVRVGGNAPSVVDPSQSKFSTTTVNYCCNDSGVRAIRLQV